MSEHDLFNQPEPEPPPRHDALVENARALYRLSRQLDEQARQIADTATNLRYERRPPDSDSEVKTDPALLGSVIDDVRSCLCQFSVREHYEQLGLTAPDVELVFIRQESDCAFGVAVDRGDQSIRHVYGGVSGRAEARFERGLSDDEEMNPYHYLSLAVFDRDNAKMLVTAIRKLWPELLE